MNTPATETQIAVPRSPTVFDPMARIAAIARFLGAPILMSLAVLVLLLVFAPPQAGASLIFTGEALLSILPFILLSVGVAAALKASGADQLVARAFEGQPMRAIVLASIFGALSPFCSCGVIPLVAGLLAAGVPIAPVLAFCIASPIMDPEMFILTAAGLGLEFAVVKTFAAMGMGMLAGYGSLLITRTGALDDALKSIARPSCGSSKCSGSAATESKTPVWRFWQDAGRRVAFAKEAGNAGWFLGRWLTFAFLLESLMVAYVPGQMVAAWLGNGNPLAIPLAVLVGVPAYLNGYAAIPLVRGLIDLGMSPATGMAFMLAGSVTSIPAAIAVWSIAKPRLFGLYLGFAAAGATISAVAYGGWIAIG